MAWPGLLPQLTCGLRLTEVPLPGRSTETPRPTRGLSLLKGGCRSEVSLFSQTRNRQNTPDTRQLSARGGPARRARLRVPDGPP